jgi:hypothetical protein
MPINPSWIANDVRSSAFANNNSNNVNIDSQEQITAPI